MREGVLELVRPARVIEEVRRGERKIDVARFADRLAPVHRFQYRELTRALLQNARDPEEVLRALAGTDARPAVGIRRARGFHRPVDIRLAGLGDLGEGRLTRGIDRRVPLVREGLHELTADEEPVAVLEMNDLTGFGRGRVVPGRWDRRGSPRACRAAPAASPTMR